MRRPLALLLVIPLLLSGLCGCASRYGEQKTTVNYYPGCYRPIQDLRERENDVAKGTAGGAAMGALGGALLGLLASGGKWEGAAAGAVGGAAAGGVMGNIYAQKQRQRDDNRRLASYLQDIDGDISDLDITSAAARTSLQCYDQQFALLLRDIRARAIDRETAAKRFAEISSGREEAIALLGNAVAHARNLDQQYEEAFANEERAVASPRAAAQGPERQRQNARAIRVARQKKQDLTQKTAALDREKTEATQVTTRQTQEINEALADIRA